MSVKIELRKHKSGNTTARLIINDRGRRFEPIKGFKILKNDTDRKHKLKILEAIRSKRELELFNDGNDLQIISGTAGICDVFEVFIRTSTLEGIKKYVNTRKKVDKYMGNKLVSEISSYDSQMFLEFLYSEVAINTANTYFSAYKKILGVARKKNLIRTTPLEDIVSRSSVNVKIKDVLFSDEFRQLLKFPLCARDNGLREACILSYYSGIGFKDSTRLDSGQIRSGILHYKRGKSQNEVSIPLNEDVLNLFKDKKGLVFPKLPSMHRTNFLLNRWIARADIDKHITFYSFRHSFAVNLLIHGANIIQVKNAMGHTTLKHTVKYLNFVDQLNENPALNIPNVLQPQPPTPPE